MGASARLTQRVGACERLAENALAYQNERANIGSDGRRNDCGLGEGRRSRRGLRLLPGGGSRVASFRPNAVCIHRADPARTSSPDSHRQRRNRRTRRAHLCRLCARRAQLWWSCVLLWLCPRGSRWPCWSPGRTSGCRCEALGQAIPIAVEVRKLAMIHHHTLWVIRKLEHLWHLQSACKEWALKEICGE